MPSTSQLPVLVFIHVEAGREGLLLSSVAKFQELAARYELGRPGNEMLRFVCSNQR